MKKTEVFVLLLTVFCFITGSFAAFAAQCSDVQNSSLRLHIIANSDSDEDQALKLKIRDRIIEKSPQIFSEAKSLEDAKKSAYDNLDILDEIAEDVIKENGYDYNASCKLVNMYFKTREYEDFTMPAGYYDALRIEIGEAQGHNWWCVMFPPMCLPAAESNNAESKIVEEYKNEHEIVKEKPQYEIKFAIVEFFKNLIK